MAFFKNLQVSKIKKKIDKLNKNIENIVKNSKYESIEYCNIKRTKVWAEDENGYIKWKFHLDVLSAVPMVYEIQYNSHLKNFTAASPKSAMNTVRKLPKIKADNIQDFLEKFIEFVNSLPILRERILKEYLFAVMKQKSRQRFLKKFMRSSKKEEFLLSILEMMFNEKRISKRELALMKEYIPHVTS